MLKNKKILIGLGIVLAIILSIGGFILLKNSKTPQNGITIVKNDILNKGYKFYPYKSNGTNIEIVAVKASDGSIKTAFNTCQVCYSSGKGYYKVVNNMLECQNCGNQFYFEEVGNTKGGCNPVPILSKDKTEDDSNITISDDYIKSKASIFKSWKTQE